MTNLKLINNHWNEAQQAYYKPVLDELVKNKIITGTIKFENERDLELKWTRSEAKH
jgi:hypothetical protein